MNYKQGKLAIESEIDKHIENLEKEIMKEFKTKQDETLSVIQKYYANFLVDQDPADYYSTLSLYNRMDSMEKEIKSVFIKLNSDTYKMTKTGQEQIFDESYYRNKYLTSYFTSNAKYQNPNNLIKDISVTGDVNLVKKIKDKELKRQAQGYISKSGKTLSSIIRDNNETSLTKVYRNLKQGLINGTSYAKQAKAIRSEFGSNAYNALRVARTEGNRNASAGAYANTQDLKKQGIDTVRQWIATLDSRTRDTHQSLDGQKEDKNGLFWIGLDSAKYPGDFANVKDDVNCRCTTIDIIDGKSPQVRRGINPVTGKSEIISFKNYDEWKNKGKAGTLKTFKIPPMPKQEDYNLFAEFYRAKQAYIKKYGDPNKKPVVKEIKPLKKINKTYRKQLSNSGNENAIKQIGIDLNIGETEATRIHNSVRYYTSDGYRAVRNINNKSDSATYGRINLETLISRSPSYDGMIYRGIQLENDIGENFVSQLVKGAEIDMKGISSWSSNANKAKDFAMKNYNKTSVIFETKNVTGIGIEHLSVVVSENEVLHSGNTKFIIDSVVESFDKATRNKLFTVKVKEVV